MTYLSDVLKAQAGSPSGQVAVLSGATSVSGTYTVPAGAPVQVTAYGWGQPNTGQVSLYINGVPVAMGPTAASAAFSASVNLAGGATYTVTVQGITGTPVTALITQRKID